MPDMWRSGAAYQDLMGRWSVLVAEQFLSWLAQPPRRRWVDVGCGTGALSSQVLDRCDPASVVGVDPSEDFVDFAREHLDDPRVELRVGVVDDLPGGSADVVVSGLVLGFLPDPVRSVQAMGAVAADGVVAGYFWDADVMGLATTFWDAASAVDPERAAIGLASRPRIGHPDRLAELWRAAGMSDVGTTAVDIDTVFRDFDDYWRPFTGGQGPPGAYLASVEPDVRDRIRERLRGTVPREPDGTIVLRARAWAVRGEAPAATA